MRRAFRTCFPFIALCSISAVHAEDAKEIKILARGDWTHLPTHASAGIGTDREPRRSVIRNAAELEKAAGSGARVTMPAALGGNEIDFKKQMVLAVEDGTQPLVGVSGGGAPSATYAVSISRIERDDKAKTLTVHWRRVPRGKDQGILTRPLEAVLVEHFGGEVKFNRLPPSDQPVKDPAVVGVEMKPIARAFWADGWPPEEPRKEWIVRDASELIDPRLRAPEHVLEKMRQQAKARYAKALKVDDIDFAKNMIVGVSDGVQPAGSRVDVTKAEVSGKTMVLHWRLLAPERPEKGITHPAAVILVEKFAGGVRFRKESKDR